MISPELDAVRRGAEQLRRRLIERHPDDPQVAAELEELSATVETLAVEREQLRQQHDEVAALADQLERDRRRYRAFFDEVPDPYLVTDEAGMVHECSRRAREVLGSELHRRPLLLAVAREQWPAFHQFLERRARHGGGETTLTFATRSAPARMQVLCRPLGRNRLLWLLRDVTEIEATRARLADMAGRDRRVATELRRLDELRRSFLLAVSHDLRAPLAAIVGLTDLLGAPSQLSDDDRDRVVAQIRTSAQRVVELFSDLLDLERIEHHDRAPHRQRVDVGATVANTANQADLGARTLRLEVEPAPGLVDPVLIGRIVENLLRNATQHTPEGTTVWVRCHREPDGVLIVVEDDGPGVPRDLSGTVFELFQRGRRPGGEDGLGVGLALVRRFAELHGGRVRLEDRPGGGASFHVLLPAGP